MKKRKDGWYWVKFGKTGKWVVRGFFQGNWTLCATWIEPHAPAIIGPRIEPPKEKR